MKTLHAIIVTVLLVLGWSHPVQIDAPPRLLPHTDSVAEESPILEASTETAPVIVEPTDGRRAKTLTPASRNELVAALRDGHTDVYGFSPPDSRLASAWAQVALENGQGAQLWNHNLGNVGPGSSSQAYYIHSNITRYRAFDTFRDGAAAYWSTVRRCSAAVAAFDTGRPRDAAVYLKRCGYYGADVDTYADGMASLYWLAMHKILPAERSQTQ